MDAKAKSVMYEILGKAPPEMVAHADALSERIKDEQAKMGVHNPQCGTLTALEIWVRVGVLLKESTP